MTKATQAPFGQRFLEAYQRRGGALTAFRGDHVASMRAAERGELLGLVRDLGLLGRKEAQRNGLRGVRRPDDLARQVLDEQRRVTRSNLLVTAACAAVVALAGLLYRLLA